MDWQFKVYAPDSKGLQNMLACWPGRELAYANVIKGEDAIWPRSGNQKVSLIVDLKHPEIMDLAYWKDLAKSASVELVFLLREGRSVKAQIISGVSDICIWIDPRCRDGMAKNIGSLYATAPYLIFMADFLTLDRDAPAILRDCLERGKKIARGRILHGRNEFDPGSLDMGSVSRSGIMDFSWCMAVTKESFIQMGGFDEVLPEAQLGLDMAIRTSSLHGNEQIRHYCAEAIFRLSSFPEYLKRRDVPENLFHAKYPLLGELAEYSPSFGQFRAS